MWLITWLTAVSSIMCVQWKFNLTSECCLKHRKLPESVLLSLGPLFLGSEEEAEALVSSRNTDDGVELISKSSRSPSASKLAFISSAKSLMASSAFASIRCVVDLANAQTRRISSYERVIRRRGNVRSTGPVDVDCR